MFKKPLYFIVVVIVIIVGGALLLQKPNPSTTQADSVETAPQPPGDSVRIPRVVLSRPGFVMIHRAQGGYSGAIVEEKFIIQ